MFRSSGLAIPSFQANPGVPETYRFSLMRQSATPEHAGVFNTCKSGAPDYICDLNLHKSGAPETKTNVGHLESGVAFFLLSGVGVYLLTGDRFLTPPR